MAELYRPLTTLAELVPDGARICLPKQYPFALLRELVRQGRRELDIVAAPTGNFGVDFLVAAGAVRSVESGAIHLNEYGLALNFNRAWEAGEVEFIESSCPIIEMALHAGSAGLSFTPVPGLIGSDILRDRPDFLVVPDPFDPAVDVVLAPAIAPDVALVHGLRADAHGNVVCSIYNDERLIAQAATIVLATVEEVREDALSALAADEQVIPSIYFDAIAVAPMGAHPLGAGTLYDADRAALRTYVHAAGAAQTMREYVDHVVLDAEDEAEYRRRAVQEVSHV